MVTLPLSKVVIGVEIDTCDNKTTTDGNWLSTIVVFSLNMKLDWADWPRPNLKKLGCTLTESFFVNGVEIDAHKNKNTIGANLSTFMADLVVYELLQGRKHLS